MDRKQILDYLGIYKKGLLEDILPFWLKHAMDWEDGGYTFCLDRDGSVIDTDKGIWQTGRFAWMLLTLYNEVEEREEWLRAGLHGISFLEKHGFGEGGKMYFLVNKKGQPLRMRRYVYSESFAAIAYAAAFRATGQDLFRQRALDTFERFRNYHDSPGLIPPKYSPVREMKSMGPPMIGIATAQELRLNLGDKSMTAYIDLWTDEIRRDFLNHKFQAVMETVGPSGAFIDHFDGRTLNPGHAMEGAWFILREALHRGNDPELTGLGTTMLDWMWEIGWDKEYGGIFYFRDVKGLPVQEYWHDMKFWWPHNEAIIAALLAYRLTGSSSYSHMHRMVHEWAFSHFPDQDFGEWYGYLHRDGRISVPLKGNIWKGPFHVPRMYYMGWMTCEAMLNE